MIILPGNITVPESDIEFTMMRASGAGGQHVNKTSSAVHLRFDVMQSSLPEAVKRKVMALRDRRITSDGVIVIKAQEHRSQEKNRKVALARLAEILCIALQTRKVRKPTKPSRGANQRRITAKKQRGQTKSLRGRVRDDH